MRGSEAARAAAGLPDARFHDLRHTWASRIVAKRVWPASRIHLVRRPDFQLADFSRFPEPEVRGPYSPFFPPLLRGSSAEARVLWMRTEGIHESNDYDPGPRSVWAAPDGGNGPDQLQRHQLWANNEHRRCRRAVSHHHIEQQHGGKMDRRKLV